jgi:hypothetical protein
LRRAGDGSRMKNSSSWRGAERSPGLIQAMSCANCLSVGMCSLISGYTLEGDIITCRGGITPSSQLNTRIFVVYQSAVCREIYRCRTVLLVQNCSEYLGVWTTRSMIWHLAELTSQRLNLT